MLSLDRKTTHAVEAMITIASHQGSQSLSGKIIAHQHDLPPRYLEQVLQSLVRYGLLRGIRGPRGGYVLAREKRKITLADIVLALQKEGDAPAALTSHPTLGGILQTLNDHMLHQLGEHSLQSLIPEDATPQRLANFSI